MNNSGGSIIGNYLNYVGENAGQAKEIAASGCLNYIIKRARYLIENGFISQEIMYNIAIQFPPNVGTAIKMSPNGDEMTQEKAVIKK